MTAATALAPDQQRPRQRAVAVDGKTLRGARGAGADGRRVHLLACTDHTSRTVLAQRQVGGAPEEVPAFQPLLDGLDLAGTVVTADALHTTPTPPGFLVAGKQAHYLFCVKANQPTLLARCQRLPWHRVPVLDTTPRPRPRPQRAPHPRRPSPSTTSGSPTPPRSSRSPARPVPCEPEGGRR